MPQKSGPRMGPFPYAPPFLRLSGPFLGYAESPRRRCRTRCLMFRLRADAPLRVTVQHRRVGAWATWTVEGQDIQQLLRVPGETLRLLVTGTAGGLVELVVP